MALNPALPEPALERDDLLYRGAPATVADVVGSPLAPAPAGLDPRALMQPLSGGGDFGRGFERGRALIEGRDPESAATRGPQRDELRWPQIAALALMGLSGNPAGARRFMELRQAQESRRQAEDERQRRRDEQDENQQIQRDQNARMFMQNLLTNLQGMESESAGEQYVQFVKGLAPRLSIEPGAIDALWRGVRPTITAKQAAKLRSEAADRIAGIDRQYTDPQQRADLERGAAVFTMSNGEKLTLPQLRARANMQAVDPVSGAAIAPTAGRAADGEGFDAHFGDVLAAENERRAAEGQRALTRREIANLRIRERERWMAAGRRAEGESGPSPSEQRAERRERERTLRAELRDAIAYPTQQAPGTMRRLSREFKTLGVEFDRAIRETKAQMARDKRAESSARRAYEFGGTRQGETPPPTADEIGLEFDALLERELAGEGGAPAAPPAPAGPAVPAAPATLRPGATYVFRPGVGLVPKQ